MLSPKIIKVKYAAFTKCNANTHFNAQHSEESAALSASTFFLTFVFILRLAVVTKATSVTPPGREE